MGPQGIFKPKLLDLPLTITTAPERAGRARSYDDRIGDDGVIRYRYRGAAGEEEHRDNVGLREAHRRRVPLVYFHGVDEGWYVAAYPAFVVGDDPASLTFAVQVDAMLLGPSMAPAAAAGVVADAPERRYATRVVQQRLHQQDFRARLLRAYRGRCAVCRLGHRPLLDAAHILRDGDPRSAPVVPNGLALCKLHHAAYDAHLLGVDPDCRVHLPRRILEEPDGPMLEHGLKGFEGARLHTPAAAAQRPNRAFLEERFAAFRAAG